MDAIATKLAELVDLMTALGFTNARAVDETKDGERIVGTVGAWDGADYEMTFVVNEHIDVVLGHLELAIRRHVENASPTSGRT